MLQSLKKILQRQQEIREAFVPLLVYEQLYRDKAHLFKLCQGQEMYYFLSTV